MEAILVILAIIILCMLLSHKKQESSAKDRAAHRTDGDSHVYYRKDGGQLLHESDSCYGCMADHVADLQSSGCQIEEVVYGRRHSGDLKW